MHMAHALKLAQRGLFTTDPNPRVGCVLVGNGAVVGEGWHARAGEPHAEVLAMRAAGERARGATAYVTLEPCSHVGRTPPCADALIAAGVARVCCATEDPNPQVAGAGIQRLRAAGVAVDSGVLAAEARALNVGFFSRFERGRPYVRLKLAMSLDGRTAQAGGVKAWISGEASRADVQQWRARSSAVLTGAGTVRADDPRLDVRLDYGAWVRQPLRVLLDSTLSCDPQARIFQGGGAVVFAAEEAAAAVEPLAAADVAVAGPGAAARMGELAPRRVERVPRAGAGLDLDAVLERLTGYAVNELLVECGPRLAAGFLAAMRVDQLILYVAPSFLGAAAAPLTALAGAGLDAVKERFEFTEVRRIGADLRLILEPRKA
jgi:diaminohydroxyphosphoribosylaminopyrimidine deaminase/5-amino-6-(5-phosphoribosylamino)uracil reductase